MINEYKNKEVTWLDLENPTQDEAREIAEKYKIDPLVANELLSPTVRPKVDYHKDYIYLILHFPTDHTVVDNSDEDAAQQHEDKIQEIDFIIGKDFIITTRYNAVDALLEFSKSFEVQSILQKDSTTDHAGYLFYFMIQHLYRTLTNHLNVVTDMLRDIEHKIFSGKEKQMVVEISNINRLLLNYKQSTSLHKEILESFEIAGNSFFGEEFSYHSRGILGEYHKVRSEMRTAKEYVDELRNTNDSLLTTKQNEIMKILTIMAFVTFPLSVIASIFGMNTEYIPIVGLSNDFWIIIGLMALLTASFFIWFKKRGWL